MKRLGLSCSSALLFWALASSIVSAQNNILFVGNSFTFVPAEQSYNNSHVTDLNGTSMGGVPGIFQQMASSLNYSCTVSIEAVPSQNFAFHYNNERTLIGQSKWNTVVLQDYSTEPTSAGDVNSYMTYLGMLKTVIRTPSPNAKIFLYETWARADLCSLGGGTTFPDLATMLSQLHTNYYNGNSTYNLDGVAPVGDGFALAIANGYADANPYNGIDSGKFNIWDTDSYHESKYGAYLAAAIFIERIAGLDPRTLPVSGTSSSSAAVGLGISSTQATHLNSIAYQVISFAPTITNGPATASGIVGTAYNFSYVASALPTAMTYSLVSGTLPLGVTLGSSTGLLSGTPTLAGIYSGTISGSNGFGTAATQNFNITVSGNYNQWASYYGAGGATATPQNDGVTNLLKYFCDIKPNAAMSAGDRAMLPTPGSYTSGGSIYLTLQYRQNASATGITPHVQTSTDLVTWTDATPDATQTVGTDATTHDPITQVAVKAMPGASREYIRLNVSMP